jgi:hypothetical protein
MEPVTVHFKLSEKEWVAACRWLLRRSAMIRIYTAFSVCLTLLFLFELLTLPVPLLFLLKWWVPIFAVMFGCYYGSLSVIPRRAYRGDRKFRHGVTFTFAEDHFTAQGKYMESKIDWKLYTGVREAEKMYLLVYGQDIGLLTPIPKRAFRNKSDERAFRSIVFPRFDNKLEGRCDDEAAPAVDDYKPAALQPPDWR